MVKKHDYTFIVGWVTPLFPLIYSWEGVFSTEIT